MERPPPELGQEGASLAAPAVGEEAAAVVVWRLLVPAAPAKALVPELLVP